MDTDGPPPLERHPAAGAGATYTRRFRVPADVIDAYRHVNNIAYVQWMQDVGIEHLEALGWTLERYLAAGVAWVARSHYVEYLKPAFEGEPIALHTWLAEMGERACTRRYLFRRESDECIVVKAETVWVCVDPATGRARAIPDDMRPTFPIAAGDEAVKAELGLARLG